MEDLCQCVAVSAAGTMPTLIYSHFTCSKKMLFQILQTAPVKQNKLTSQGCADPHDAESAALISGRVRMLILSTNTKSISKVRPVLATLKDCLRAGIGFRLCFELGNASSL